MPGCRDPDDFGGGVPSPHLSLRQRLRPPAKPDQDSAPLGQRLRDAVMKPAQSDAAPASVEPPSVEDLEDDVRSADDKERLVGLLAAPFAAAIGILVIRALIVNDPPVS